MAKEISEMLAIYQSAYKDMRKKLIKDLKSKRISVGDLIVLKRNFEKFYEIYNNLIYFSANAFEVK